MTHHDLTELNRRYGSTAPPPPRWYAHEDCGQCCDCYRRGRLDEKEAEQARRWEAEIEARKARLGEEEEMSVFRVCITLLLTISAAIWVAKNCIVWN